MAKRNKSWKDQLHTLDQRREAILELVEQYTPEESEDLLRDLQNLRTQQDELDLKKQRLSERIDAISQVMADRWDAAGVSSMKIDDLGTFSLQVKLHVSTADKEVYHAWLRENGYETLIQPTVAPKTTESMVRERLEEGLPCDNIGLNIHYRTVVR